MLGFGSTGNGDKPAQAVLPWPITLALALGVLVLGAYAAASADRVKTFVILFILSGAAFLVGALVGFLFGIPRSRTDSPRHTDEQMLTAGPIREKYWDNANLEEVSDWLTKIIVGLGLVEFGRLSGFFAAVGEVIEPVLGQDGKIVLQGSLLYFVVLGFIFCYFWTRVVFYGILSDVSDIRQSFRRELQEEVGRFETRTAENLEENVIITAAQNALGASGTDPQRRLMAEKLEELAKKGQLDANGFVVLGRLYRGLKDLQRATSVLTTYIDQHQNVVPPHRGMHAALYNRACYFALRYANDQDVTLVNHVLSDLRLSLKYSTNLENDRVFAQEDQDFASIRNDPRFVEIIKTEEPPAKAAGSPTTPS